MGAPSRTLVAAALAAGKSVVTANKHVIAHHGPELERLRLAMKYPGTLFYDEEAWYRTALERLRECLAARSGPSRRPGWGAGPGSRRR